MNDTISRQAAIDIADDLRDCISVEGYWAWMERLKKLPSAEVEPVKRGCWIVYKHKPANREEYFYYAVCSECGDMFNCVETIEDKPIWNYCPNCDAKMEGTEHGRQ